MASFYETKKRNCIMEPTYGWGREKFSFGPGKMPLNRF